jgi:ABC-type uncharacterized transport system substrate-binding protein
VRRIASALALVALPLAHALAHPHVFIANRMAVVFDADTLRGIELQWTFDEMFSSTILADFKPDRTGRFSPQDARALREAAFDNLENYHYFVSFWVGQKPLGGLRVEQFVPSVVDRGKLVYTFFIPLGILVTPQEQELRATVYDDSYFTAFDPLKPEHVAVKAPDVIVASATIGKTKVPEAWPGQYMPDQLVVRFKRR